MKAIWRMIGSTAAVLLIGLLTAATTLANGKPVRLFLNYLPETSNWGPQTASGSAVVGVGDGFVQLTVQGLPRLEGERYTVWLVPQEGETWVRIGDFNMEAGQEGNFGWSPEDFPYQEYRLIVLTVEPDPDPDGQPGSRISLVGHFPNPDVAPPSPVSEGSSGGAAEERPERLPVTGADLALPPTEHLVAAVAIALTAILWLLVALGGWWLTRKGRVP